MVATCLIFSSACWDVRPNQHPLLPPPRSSLTHLINSPRSSQSAPRKKRPVAAPQQRRKARNSVADSLFVCREPVLNQREQIAGYTFDLQEGLQTRLQGRRDMLHRAYDDALLRSLASPQHPQPAGASAGICHDHPYLAEQPAAHEAATGKSRCSCLSPVASR